MEIQAQPIRLVVYRLVRAQLGLQIIGLILLLGLDIITILMQTIVLP